MIEKEGHDASLDLSNVQGDPSGWFKPPDDIKTNVAFQYMFLILKTQLLF